MAKPQSKAQGFISFLQTLKEVAGAHRYQHFVETLPPHVRALVEKPPLPMSWMDVEPWDVLNKAVVDVLGHGKPEYISEIARLQMHADMKGVYKFFMHLASPSLVMKRAAAIYSNYTTDGTMAASLVAPKTLEVVIAGQQNPDVVSLHFHRGTITGVLECTGVKVTVEIVKQSPQEFVYRATWS